MSWLDGTRTRLRLLLAPRAAESRMNEEFRFHIEMEAERLVREAGLAPEEARRRALATFGGVENHKEALRTDRGLAGKVMFSEEGLLVLQWENQGHLFDTGFRGDDKDVYEDWVAALGQHPINTEGKA